MIWLSKLQPSVALSTTEAEYAALSHVMRIITPMRSLLLENLRVVQSSKPPSDVKFYVHEDNSSAHLLATQQKVTSRTRHFNVKYHHYWEMVNELKIIVEQCPTDQQKADYLTKGLYKPAFEACRKSNQGW